MSSADLSPPPVGDQSGSPPPRYSNQHPRQPPQRQFQQNQQQQRPNNFRQDQRARFDQNQQQRPNNDPNRFVQRNQDQRGSQEQRGSPDQNRYPPRNQDPRGPPDQNRNQRGPPDRNQRPSMDQNRKAPPAQNRDTRGGGNDQNRFHQRPPDNRNQGSSQGRFNSRGGGNQGRGDPKSFVQFDRFEQKEFDPTRVDLQEIEQDSPNPDQLKRNPPLKHAKVEGKLVKTLFLYGFDSSTVTEKDIYSMIAPFGFIRNIHLIKNGAYVELDDKKEANNVLSSVTDCLLAGQTFNITFAYHDYQPDLSGFNVPLRELLPVDHQFWFSLSERLKMQTK